MPWPPQVQVPGFSPEANGFHFTNYFPHEPTIQIKIPLGPALSLGDAANGLCGGMAFAVRDFYEADQPTPPDTDPTIYTYDPNYPNRNNVTLQLSIASIQVPVTVVHNPVEPGEDVNCFFRTPYSPKTPPTL